MSKARFISPGEMGIEITKLLAEYTQEVSEAIAEEIDRTSKLMLDDVKANAPKRRPKYNKGFKIKKDDSKEAVQRIIHNQTHPGLVHVLELGHVNRDGGRTSSIPHLRPAFDKYAPKMEKNIEEIIKNGGK